MISDAAHDQRNLFVLSQEDVALVERVLLLNSFDGFFVLDLREIVVFKRPGEENYSVLPLVAHPALFFLREHPLFWCVPLEMSVFAFSFTEEEFGVTKLTSKNQWLVAKVCVPHSILWQTLELQVLLMEATQVFNVCQMRRCLLIRFDLFMLFDWNYLLKREIVFTFWVNSSFDFSSLYFKLLVFDSENEEQSL